VNKRRHITEEKCFYVTGAAPLNKITEDVSFKQNLTKLKVAFFMVRFHYDTHHEELKEV
jgi:hypothetical protein